MLARLVSHRAVHVAAVGIVIAALVGGAVAGSAKAVQPSTESRVVVGMEQEPACLNVVLADCNTAWGWWIANLAVAGAFRLQPDGSYQPELVDHVDVTTSPTFSLTYHLKPQAVWSDGVPVGADDFVFTWQAIVNPSNAIAERTGYDQITGATVLDSKTVRFDFSAPVAGWRELFAQVYPQHLLAGQDFDNAWRNEIADPTTHVPVGDGPYLITSWTHGQGLTLVRNPRWWGPHAPYLNEIDFTLTPNATAEVQALLGGQVDVLAPSAQGALSQLSNQPGVVMQSTDGLTMEHLDFNVAGGSQPLLHQQWFRQAVAYAIDRQAIVDATFGSFDPAPTVAQNLVYSDHRPEYQPSFAAYDVDLAKVADLMTSNGCTKGSDGIYVCNGDRASFTLSTTAGNARRATEVSIIQSDLAAAGIEVVPDFEPAATLFGSMLPAHAFDAVIYAWAWDDDPAGADEIYGCNEASDYNGYCSAEVTADLQAANSELDPTTRAADINEAMAVMAADVPSLPLVWTPALLYSNTSVHGLEVNGSATSGPFWNAADWRGAFSTLTVARAGSGAGTVSSSPAGIACGSTCSTLFADSTPVQLTASAAAGSRFDGWQGDCTGTGACTVTLAGNRDITAVFTDVAPPTLTVPSGVAADATSPAGATVAYTATAVDNIDPTPSVSCSPASGSTFPIGNTTVTCMATDATGNAATARFTVHVRGAAEQIVALRARVAALHLRPAVARTLDAELATAESLLARGQKRLASDALTLFQIEARLLPPSLIAPTDAAGLVADANRIRAVLG